MKRMRIVPYFIWIHCGLCLWGVGYIVLKEYGIL